MLNIANSLGLKTENFCRMCLRTKMLLSNVIGHAAELHYEKYLKNNKFNYNKAPTDCHYDFFNNNKKEQVKRFETVGTNLRKISVNLTQTHGDRSAQDAFYRKDSFERLIIYDVGFKNFFSFDTSELPSHSKYQNHIKGSFSFQRELNDKDDFNVDFLMVLKNKNKSFQSALENLRTKYRLSYSRLLEKVCNLNLREIDSLFCDDNFRLIVGAKGFAAEEHFNTFLENNRIIYKQDNDMYSKVDHWIGTFRIQVKTPHQRSTNEEFIAFKTHKSHGHGVKELYSNDVFDMIALYDGFEMNTEINKYLPISATNTFYFIPIEDLEEHPKYSGYLKRITKLKRKEYKINDLILLKSKICND